MSIRPQWLKDICSILFSVYYIVYANEADEKVRVVSILHHDPLGVLPNSHPFSAAAQIPCCTDSGNATYNMGEND